MSTNRSIAVLPFVNMSGDLENEYFSDGITEEIINALTKAKGLKVIARTSSFAYKGKNIDVRTIGKELGVSTLLEGSVRRAAQRVRITAQLIDTNEGIHIWSKNFDRDFKDIFALQDEISLKIADLIQENFGHFTIHEPAITIPTQNVDAYDIFLRGSYHFKRKDFDDIKKAMAYFQKATKLDPQYAEAYAFMGETYLHFAGFGLMPTDEAHQKAEEAVNKALSINAKEARAHKVMAYINLFFHWKWDDALLSYKQAIDNGLANQNEFITYYYIFLLKDFESAIQVAKEVVETDPLHIITHWQLGLCYYFAQQYDKALNAFDNALAFDPNFGEALRWKGIVLGYLGKFKEGLLAVDQAIEVYGGEGPANYDRLVVLSLMGQKEAVLNKMETMTFIDPCDPAMLYSLLNMPTEAVSWLQKGYTERSVMMVTLKHFWIWDNIRGDNGFQKVYQQMDFSEQPVLDPGTLQQIAGRVSDQTSTPLLDAQEVSQFSAQLKKAMSNEQLFLDPSLSLRKLAQHLGLHPNKLSWLLNEQLNKNFSEYINAFRLNAFKQKATNPKNAQFTLLALAFESGFNSKTVFNTFFKKMEGTTPRTWLKAQQNQAS